MSQVQDGRGSSEKKLGIGHDRGAQFEALRNYYSTDAKNRAPLERGPSSLRSGNADVPTAASHGKAASAKH